MTHRERVLGKLARDWRMLAGAIVLASLLLASLFAEVIAADAPVIAIGDGGVLVLPALRDRAAYQHLSREQIDARHAGDTTLWPLLRQSPTRQGAPLAGASRTHPLGTDSRGRDVLAALVYGARAALAPALLALGLAVVLGCLFGGLAGYYGGFWDELLSRPIELVQAIPSVVVVAVAMAIDPRHGFWSLVLAITLLRWAEIARITRAESIRIASLDFVTAARAAGGKHGWILRRHVLPHAAGAVLISAIFALPSLVLLEAAVAFLGIGLSSSWGTLVADGFAPNGSRWAAGCATALLLLTVAATRLLAEAIGEALDAKLPPAGMPTSRSRA